VSVSTRYVVANRRQNREHKYISGKNTLKAFYPSATALSLIEATGASRVRYGGTLPLPLYRGHLVDGTLLSGPWSFFAASPVSSSPKFTLCLGKSFC